MAVGGVALAALLAVGVHDLAERHDPQGAAQAQLTAAQTRALLAGSPAPLAALHAQSDELLSGGAAALRARLTALKGLPVVVDKWASWCTSCQAERAIFQQAAAREGRRVAFIGIDSGDFRHEAEAFLRAAPQSYPSYWDPGGSLGEAVTDSKFYPATVFYTPTGSRYIHDGPYESVAELERDVARYATGTQGA
jgi:cytochrome c biogenesis protein CcmG/thiol:disulfide interchange protein DsbE